MEMPGANLFSFLVLMHNRHVEANSVGGSLYAFLGRQVDKRVVTIQECLSESKSGCRREKDWYRTNLIHTLRT